MHVQVALGRERVGRRIELVDCVSCISFEEDQARIAELERPMASA